MIGRVDGKTKTIIINNTPEIISMLKQAEQYRLAEKRNQREKNRLLYAVHNKQQEIAKELTGAKFY